MSRFLNRNKIAILFIMMLFVFALTSCDKILENNQNENDEKAEYISKSSFFETSNKYEVVDSYVLDDGNYYYFYFLGTVDYVPLNISESDGMFFNGNEAEITFTMKATNVEHSQKAITNIAQKNVSLTTSTYKDVSTNMEFEAFKAKIDVGIKSSATNSITKTSSETFIDSVSKESSFEKSVTYNFTENNPIGFYFYTPIASMKVYEVVVYNPVEEVVVHMSTYTQFGSSMPGLYYSPFSYIDDLDYSVDFDENRLPEFEKPSKNVDSKIEIKLDANGGNCEKTTIETNIGNKYGILPKVEKKGYIFKGWSCNGNLINEETIVLSNDSLKAEWELITSAIYKTSGEITVSSVSKLNPFALIMPGMNGATSTSGIELSEYFDFDELKAQGYKMRIIIDYKAKHAPLALFGLKYKINFKSNGSTIIKFSDSVSSSSFKEKHNVSSYISLDQVNGNIGFNVETENVMDLTIKGLVITVEFVK